MTKRTGKNLFFILSLFTLALYVYSCKHEVPVQPKAPANNPGNPNNPGGGGNTNSCHPDTVYFERDILPILISNCAKSPCHDQGSAQDGVILNNYTNVMATADVRPFNPGGSDLYEVITETDSRKRMPKDKAPLPSDQIALIRKWINQGAQNKKCSDTGTCDTSNVTFSATVKPILQRTCVGCHSGGTAASGGIDMNVFSQVETVARNGKLVGVISHAAGFKPMPQGGSKLPDCDIAKIKSWVDNGALNN